MTRNIRGIRGRSNRVFRTELQIVARDAVAHDGKMQANHKMIGRRRPITGAARPRELRASHPAARKIAEGYRVEIAEAQQ
jgi:hypothetical protein